MKSIAVTTNDPDSAVLTAPDGCTKYRAPSRPTDREMADWCHPRSKPDRWMYDHVVDPVAERAGEEPDCLLGVWAHPDDEAYLSAGLMARTIAAGGRVVVVAITDGEAGFSADDARPVERRAAQRRRELRAAMEVIGVHDIRFLGVADGGVAAAPADRLVAQIGDIIREVSPDVIVTFGPDGITGHSDHVANSSLVTRAWMDGGVGELWYAAKTNEWLAEWRELHDQFGVWMTGEPTGVRIEDVETIVDLDGVALATKRAVLAEHGSQTNGLAAAFGESRYCDWICQETFRRPSATELMETSAPVRTVVS